MSDVAGAAPAVAESAPAPVVEAEAVHLQNPINTEPQAAPAPEAKKPEPTPREALQRAAAKVEAEAAKAGKEKTDGPAKGSDRDTAAPAASKTEAAPGQLRGEDGKFALPAGAEKAPEAGAQPVEAKPVPDPAPKAVAAVPDAPARFSADAKAAWAAAPDPVKAEIHRALKETEAGIEKYRSSAEAFEPVRKFHDMAKEGGTTLDKALTAYTNMENAWRKDPAVGFVAICQNRGVDPLAQAKEIVARLEGVQGLPKGDSPEVASLKRELAEVKSQVGNVSKTIQNRDLEAQISQWASTKPRFEELSDDIAKLLETSYAKDLDEAYDIACRLKPGAVASIPEPAPARTQDPDLTAQTLKGSKSVAGAPSTGSDPAKRPPSSSPRDALRKAFARAG